MAEHVEKSKEIMDRYHILGKDVYHGIPTVDAEEHRSVNLSKMTAERWRFIADLKMILGQLRANGKSEIHCNVPKQPRFN